MYEWWVRSPPGEAGVPPRPKILTQIKKARDDSEAAVWMPGPKDPGRKKDGTRKLYVQFMYGEFNKNTFSSDESENENLKLYDCLNNAELNKGYHPKSKPPKPSDMKSPNEYFQDALNALRRGNNYNYKKNIELAKVHVKPSKILTDGVSA